MSKTLKLDKTSLGIDQAMRRYDNMVEDAMEELHSKGIHLPKQPMLGGEPFIPEIPIGPDGKPSLSHLTNMEISDLNVQFLAYRDYVLAQYKVMMTAHHVLEKRYEQIKAYVRALHVGSPADKSDATNVDPRVQEADIDKTNSWITLELADGVLKVFEKDMAVISREVTIREQELGFHRRDSSIRAKRKSQYKASDFGMEESELDEEYLAKKKKKPEKDPQ